MMTDFMKEATKSFCMPLDMDGSCHRKIRTNDDDNDDRRNMSQPSGIWCSGNDHQPSPQRPPQEGSAALLLAPSTVPTVPATLVPSPPPPIPPPPPVASIYYVPSYDQEDNTMDSGEAKFLLTSTCTFCYKRRNRIPRLPHNNDQYIIRQSKPMSLRRLNDTLYCNLISDLQTTLKYRSGWFLLFWLPFCICAAVSLLVLILHSRHEEEDNDMNENESEYDDLVKDYQSSWRSISIIAIVSFVIGKILYRVKLRNIEEEIHVRVHQEWLPLFEQQGFAINYVVDDPGPFYSRKESYIHIYRINPRNTCVCSITGTSTNISFTPASKSITRNAIRNNSLINSINFRRSNSLLSRDNLAVGADCCSTTSRSKERATPSNPSIPVMDIGNEAKYLVFYPMELARRNVDARQLGYSYLSTTSSSSYPCHGKSKFYCAVGCDDTVDLDDDDDPSQLSVCYYVKPPTLRDLPGGEEGSLLLQEFLYDIEIMTSPSYTVRMILFVIIFILFILLCVYAMARHDQYSGTGSNNRAVADYYQDNLDGSFALFGFLLLIYIGDRFIRLYTNLYCKIYDVASVVEKVWVPQFQLYGYSVTYRIDQPHWYSFREDYIHIYKSM